MFTPKANARFFEYLVVDLADVVRVAQVYLDQLYEIHHSCNTLPGTEMARYEPRRSGTSETQASFGFYIAYAGQWERKSQKEIFLKCYYS